MKHFPKAFFPLFILILISCQQPDQSPQIAVQWEHITNFTGQPDVFESKFTLTHQDGGVLNDQNWTLFFNIAPRPIVPTPESQPASIEHINGDWYKMTPNQGFSLKKGETIEVYYRGTEGVIKETDRPLGLYFVFYDEDGKEKEIAEVANYSFKPFTKPEQINRNEEDYDPIPTPSYLYNTNQGLSELPEEKLDLIIPSPVQMDRMDGSLTLGADFVIVSQDGLENEAQFLADKLKTDAGINLAIQSTDPGSKTITLKTGNLNINGKSEEAYELTIDKRKITIVGSDPAGVFYGIQSLRALIPIDALETKNNPITIPNRKIKDAPRFGFRSLQLDVSRNFQTKETVMRLLDAMAFYKLNHFLLYTTEDEGWRLEIEGLPELTDIGAQRQHTTSYHNSLLHPAYGSGPYANDLEKHGGGYYTREDFIEILRYARDRHITVIPEVNFPGHARAAIKAMEYRYDRFMEAGKTKEANEYRLIDPSDTSKYLSAQGYQDNVVCVVKEEAYHFYEKVVTEIMQMYDEAGVPISKFHMGGDEVPNGAWTGSPLVAEFMSEHPEIENHHQLHAYFIRRMIDRLSDKNLEWQGWEEVVLKKEPNGDFVPNPEFVDKNVVPYIWNNLYDPDIGYQIANVGYPIVLCNVTNFYFDLAYNKDPQEPGLYWAGFINARDNWTFAPYNMFRTTTHTSMGKSIHITGTEQRDGKTVDIGKIEPDGPALVLDRLKPEAYDNIVGVEAQIWSETIKGRDMVEYYYLPKLIGFSESAWSKMKSWENVNEESKRNQMQDQEWNVFANLLANQELPRLSYMNNGYNYRIPPPGAIIDLGTLKANTEYPGLMIYYTLDGSEPNSESELYTGPIKIDGKNNSVKLKAIDKAGRSSRTTVVSTDTKTNLDK